MNLLVLSLTLSLMRTETTFGSILIAFVSGSNLSGVKLFYESMCPLLTLSLMRTETTFGSILIAFVFGSIFLGVKLFYERVGHNLVT